MPEYNVLLVDGDATGARALVEDARDALDTGGYAGVADLLICEAALLTGELDARSSAVAAVEALAPGDSSPLTTAAAARFRAALAAAAGDSERAESSFNPQPQPSASTERRSASPARNWNTPSGS